MSGERVTTGSEPKRTVMKLAEEARRYGVERVSPARLHRACEGDKDLYIEAMIAAGYLVPKGGRHGPC